MTRPYSTLLGLAFIITSSASADSRRERVRELMNLEIEELMNLEVSSATRHAEGVSTVPATVYVFTSEDFQRYGFRDLKDVLRFAPGIEYSYPQSWLQGGQRGFAGNWSQTRLMIDGRETNLLFSGEAYIADQFPLAEVERVEVIQGPASSLYGADAFVGLINIVTKNSTRADTGGSITSLVHKGSRGEVGEQVSGSYRTKNGAWATSASVTLLEKRGPDLEDFVMSEDFSTRLPDARRENLALGKGYYDYNRASQIAGEVSYDDEETNSLKIGGLYWYNFDGGNEENAEVSFNDFRDRRDQTHVYLRYGRLLTEALKVSFDHQYLRENNKITYPQRGESSPIPPGLLEFRSQGNERHRSTLQLDHDLRSFGNYLLTGVVYEDTDITMLKGTGESFEALDPFLHQVERSFYIQDQQAILNEAVRFTLGWRHDDHSIYDSIDTLRGAAVYSPAESYTLKLLYGEAFLAPTIFELRANPNVKPAQMESLELALVYQNSKTLTGQVSVFKNKATDLIVQMREGQRETALNRGGQNAEGVEGLIRWNLAPFEGFCWYTATNASTNEDLAKHKAGLGISWNYSEKLSASLTGKWASRIATKALIAEDQVEDRTIGEFRELDLTLLAKEMVIGELPVDLTFSVSNLLNTNNRYPYVRGNDPIQYEDSGRVAWLGGRVRF